MISISEIASAKVKELLEEQGKTDHALRVFVRGMSCSGPAFGMALDNEPRPDDSIADFDGLKVVVDPQSAPYLEGAQVDYVDSLTGKGFTVVNPNAAESAGGGGGGCGGGCACGSR
jgi:iron-sulfur cluster assembly accessory protein